MTSVQRQSTSGVASPHSMSNGADASEEAGTDESLAGRKLVILGIPWETHAETLRSHFSQFGAVQEAIVMRDRYSGKSRGFGFVTFMASQDAQHVASMDHVVDGRRCDAKLALPRGTTSTTVSATSPLPAGSTHRIFVARIPPTVTDPEFKSYWETFGPVQDAYMPKDASKAGHRGIGFVTFGSSEVLDKVVAASHQLHGQELAVDRAEPKLADKAVGPTERLAAPLWGHMGARGAGLPPYAASAALNGRIDGLGLARASAGGPIGPPMGAAAPSLARMSVGLYHTETAGGNQERSRAQELPASLDLEDRRLSANSGYGAQPGSAGGSYQAQGTSPYAHSDAAGVYDGQRAFSGGMSELDRATLERYALAQGFEGSSHSNGSPAQQSYGRDAAAVTSLARSMPALQGLTYEGTGTGNGLGIGYGMMQSHTLSNPYVNGREYQVDAQQGFRMPPNITEAASNPQAALPPANMVAALARSSMGSQAGRDRVLPPAAQGPRIFVGKLSKETTEADVKDYFSKFGFVLDVYLPRDKVMRTEHRGFGFVTFETATALARINAHDQPHQIKGQAIAIDDAAPRKEEDGALGEGVSRGMSPAPGQQVRYTDMLPSGALASLDILDASGRPDDRLGPARRHTVIDERARPAAYKPY